MSPVPAAVVPVVDVVADSLAMWLLFAILTSLIISRVLPVHPHDDGLVVPQALAHVFRFFASFYYFVLVIGLVVITLGGGGGGGGERESERESEYELRGLFAAAGMAWKCIAIAAALDSFYFFAIGCAHFGLRAIHLYVFATVSPIIIFVAIALDAGTGSSCIVAIAFCLAPLFDMGVPFQSGPNASFIITLTAIVRLAAFAAATLDLLTAPGISPIAPAPRYLISIGILIAWAFILDNSHPCIIHLFRNNPNLPSNGNYNNINNNIKYDCDSDSACPVHAIIIANSIDQTLQQPLVQYNNELAKGNIV